MSYQRVGGGGLTGSLRQQFSYYKSRVKERLIQEQSLKEALGGGTIEGRIYTMFKQLNFDDVFTKGITRKEGFKTVRYVGLQAVRMQIASLQRRASKSYQANIFIENYISAMEEAGFSGEAINETYNLLSSISIDKLTILVYRGYIPSIQFLYAGVMTEEEFMEELRNVIKHGLKSAELKEIRERRKELTSVVKARNKIMGW